MDPDDDSLFQSSGYSVLVGKGTMPTATYTVSHLTARSVIVRLEQAMYLLALLIAIVALTSLPSGERGLRLRRHRLLHFLSGTVALFATTDLAFAYLRFFSSQPIFGGQTHAQSVMERFVLILWGVFFASILALWLKASRSQDDAAERLRIAAMILLLPPLFFALLFLPFAIVAFCGIAAAWIGGGLLCWGLFKSEQIPAPLDI